MPDWLMVLTIIAGGMFVYTGIAGAVAIALTRMSGDGFIGTFNGIFWPVTWPVVIYFYMEQHRRYNTLYERAQQDVKIDQARKIERMEKELGL